MELIVCHFVLTQTDNLCNEPLMGPSAYQLITRISAEITKQKEQIVQLGKVCRESKIIT